VRALAGCVLLLWAAAARAQAARPDDLYHGPAGTYEKFEIRPGIILGVLYDPDGAASHMDITAVGQPGPPLWRRYPIPRDTIDSILDQILPLQTYGPRKPRMTWCWSYPCHTILFAQGVVVNIAERPLRPPFEVEDVSIDFRQTPPPPPLTPPVPDEAPQFR
jgi:hypothetical protein